MPSGDAHGDGTIIDPVGATSRLTAAARARESVRDDRLFEDGFAADLAGPSGFGALDQHDEALAATGRASPNPVFAIRTRFFDDFLLGQATRNTVRQVVLIAAGLDTRAFRLDWPPNVRIFELDQPEVLTYKDRVLRARNATPACARTVVSVDFRKPWTELLINTGYMIGEPSVWLAEGLTFYLNETAVRTLLGDIAQLALPGDALACDWVTEPPPGVDAATGFATDDPEVLFAECGWTSERYSFLHEGEQFGRTWNSPIRPLGYMTIAYRTL